MNKLAEKAGSFASVRIESYTRLDERARCDLIQRITNLKDRMKLNGATKTKIGKISYLDVIEADSRLKEIYSNIVKEMLIASGL